MTRTGQAGDRFGRWTLQSELGAGGFGVAWRATDSDGRIAALKILEEPPGDELRALERLCHPVVPAVLDARGAPTPFVAMELAPGRPLSEVMSSGVPPESAAVSVVALVADAIDSVHQAGLVHGDIKPDNIVVESMDDVRLRLVDFGMVGRSDGGTLQYAAPERLGGVAPTTASDVYSLGLVAWELLHGAVPWADADPAEALLLRRTADPEPSAGSPWVRDLVSRMLSRDPQARPTAAFVAEVCATHGAVLTVPQGAYLAKRALAGWVDRPAVQTATDQWMMQGGALAITGQAGSGRTRVARRVITEYRARGVPCFEVTPGPRPWSAIERVLRQLGDAGLDDVIGVPADERVEVIAGAVEDHAHLQLVLVADDWDRLDAGSVSVLQSLAERGKVDLLLTGSVSPAWCPSVVALEPLDREQVQAVVTHITGPTTRMSDILDDVVSISGGLPKHVTDLVVHAFDAGVMLRSGRSVTVDLAAWRGFASRWAPDAIRPPAVSAAARAVAATVSCLLRAWPVPRLASFAGLSDEQVRAGLTELAGLELVRFEGDQVTTASHTERRVLSQLCDDPRVVHQRVLRALMAQGEQASWEFGWHVVGAGARSLAERFGGPAVRASLDVDPVDAARLADALWGLATGGELAAARVEALVRAGRSEDAEALATSWIKEHGTDGGVAMALARMHLERSDWESVGQWIAAAKSAGASLAQTAVLQADVSLRSGDAQGAIAVAASAQSEALGPDDAAALRMFWAQAEQRLGNTEEALRILDAIAVEDCGQRTRSLIDLSRGRLLWYAGRLTEASEWLERSGGSDSGLSPVNRARNLNIAAIAAYQTGNRAKALQCWQDALTLFSRMRCRADAAHTQNNLGVAWRDLGMWDRSRQAFTAAIEGARALDLHDVHASALGNLGELCTCTDDLDRARLMYDATESVSKEHDLRGELVELARRQAELAALSGQALAGELAFKAVALAEDAANHTERHLAGAVAALSFARSYQVRAAERAIDEAIHGLRELGDAGALAKARLWAAEVYLELSDPERAVAECDRVTAFADEVEDVPLRQRASTLAKWARGRQAKVSGLDPRVEHLTRLAVSVAGQTDTEALLVELAGGALELLHGQRAYVIGCGPDGSDPTVVASQVLPGIDEGPPSMSIVRRALEIRREVVAADVEERGDLRTARSVASLGLRSAMCAPMLDGEDLIGALYVDSRLTSDLDLAESAAFLRALAAHAATAMLNARRMEQLGRRNEWAREIAHDMRGPVATMLMVAEELALNHDDGEVVQAASEDLRHLGNLALSMVTGFLERPEPSTAVVDLSTLILALCAAQDRVMLRAGLRLTREVQDEIRVAGDADEFTRAVQNLVSNASRYAPSGSEVFVGLHAEGAQAVVVVRDQGQGVSPELMGRIFDRGVHTNSGGSGHGLGLAIVRRLVEGQGGTITVRNDGGAVFELRFPVAADPSK